MRLVQPTTNRGPSLTGLISINQNSSYAPFLVDNNNELVPLQTGEEETADFNIIDGGAADTNY